MSTTCEYCGKEPPYYGRCTQSDNGSHRLHTSGDVRYKVRAKSDGYIYNAMRPLHEIEPDKYELVSIVNY